MMEANEFWDLVASLLDGWDELPNDVKSEPELEKVSRKIIQIESVWDDVMPTMVDGSLRVQLGEQQLRIEELEDALTLQLAVAPDDPILEGLHDKQVATLYARVATLEAAVRAIPLGDWVAGRYDTDNESVLIVRRDGKTFDIRVERQVKE